MAKQTRNVFGPLIMAGMLALGVGIGNFMSGNGPVNKKLIATNNNEKIGQVLRLIEERYVDTINTSQVVEETIEEMLYDLDPHSDYIPARELSQSSEALDGSFQGIGVEFTIQRDTLIVINPVEGGPSEQAGVKPGDRIVFVEDSLIAGVDISNETVMNLLKGPANTEVKIQVKRRNFSEILPITITRGHIPINSIASAIRISKSSAYVKLVRFARTTMDEWNDAMTKVNVTQLDNLILDLRGNGGGYLTTAVDLADEFLGDRKMIVYTEGQAYDRETHKATSKGKLDDINLYILIDENSASASEVLAGAIQDHDRGTIIGRRSFGKGLVQEQKFFDDNSAIRLTIARYYTPTGRSIQKPYGDGIDYENDYAERYESGELLSADSISFPDSLKFTTPGGKVVYGGGGIMPDLFVGIDTLGASEYFSELNYNGLINRYAFQYADDNRDRLNDYDKYEFFIENFEVNSDLLEQFIQFAENNGVDKDEKGLMASKEIIKDRLKAYIARNIWKNDAFYTALLQDDKVYNATIKYIENQ
ncbi:MAG: S41 family peptidase [Bacteroidota bacterium]